MGTGLVFGKTSLPHCKSKFITDSLKVEHNQSRPAVLTASF